MTKYKMHFDTPEEAYFEFYKADASQNVTKPEIGITSIRRPWSRDRHPPVGRHR